jgi:hypothetical protein
LTIEYDLLIVAATSCEAIMLELCERIFHRIEVMVFSAVWVTQKMLSLLYYVLQNAKSC